MWSTNEDSRSPCITSFYFSTKVPISKYYSWEKFPILFIEFKYRGFSFLSLTVSTEQDRGGGGDGDAKKLISKGRDDGEGG